MTIGSSNDVILSGTQRSDQSEREGHSERSACLTDLVGQEAE
jgi:hypothetical protein